MSSLRRKNEYIIRPYEKADRDEVLTPFGSARRRTAEDIMWDAKNGDWFEWRYGGPYLDEKAIFVAEHDGKIVGQLPCMVFPLRAGDVTTLALQPSGIAVHPDHRRQGIFSGLVEELLAYYADKEPSIIFNFPTTAARKGFTKFGWQVVGEMPSYFRAQNPAVASTVGFDGTIGRSVRRMFDGAGGRALQEIFDVLASGYFKGCRLLGSESSDLTITRHASIPIDDLVFLYNRNIRDKIHVPRDERYYEWRYCQKNQRYKTYVARQNSPIAAVVAHTERDERGVTVTNLLETLPTGEDNLDGVFNQLIGAVVADNENSDVLRATCPTIPDSAARTFGFLRRNMTPLSWVASTDPMTIRPIPHQRDDSRTINGLDITDMQNWKLMTGDWEPTF